MRPLVAQMDLPVRASASCGTGEKQTISEQSIVRKWFIWPERNFAINVIGMKGQISEIYSAR